MAREIDTSKPSKLSLEDRIYLADRGVLPAGAKVPTQAERRSLNERENEGENQDDGIIAENAGAEGGADDDAEDREYKDYEDMNVDELKEELAERELPVSGTKQELIDRLVEDDEDGEA